MQKNQREIKRIHEEIKEDYAFAVKKSVVDYVLTAIYVESAALCVR